MTNLIQSEINIPLLTKESLRFCGVSVNEDLAMEKYGHPIKRGG